jgi:hypothetical protein
MKKLTLHILFLLFTGTSFISCDSKSIRINFEYPTNKHNRNLSHSNKTNKNDTVHLIFHYGFNDDIVKIKLNGIEIYKKKLKYINAMPTTGDFEFKREKESLIQIYINQKKTKEFNFDKRYDCGIIIWDEKTNELSLEYDNLEEMVGFD